MKPTQIIVTLTVAVALAAYFAAGLHWALLAGAIVLAVGLLLVYRARILKFIVEVRIELGKCAWPWDPNQTGLKKYKELFESTLVVIISVVLLAGFVTTSDLVLAHVVGALTGGGMTK